MVTQDETTEKEIAPKVARFDLSVGISEEMWQYLKSQHASDKDMEKHIINDIEAAISQYKGYHNMLGVSGVVDITLTKYY